MRLVDINCLVDVRSIPASSHTPQFNKEFLSRFLKKNGISYLHFGEEFGARRNDSVVNGQVNFEKAATSDKFQKGVNRVKLGLEKNFHIAFMCSEANPLSCHRFALVARYFYDQGFDVQHILHSKEIKSHKQLELEMISGYLNKRNSKLRPVDGMINFSDDIYTEDDQRIDAYKLKNAEIGYKPGLAYDNEI